MAIGAAPDSIVQKFINDKVVPLTTDGKVPACLDKITPMGSSRLYDLANPVRNPKPTAESLQFALSRNPATPGEFVNFAEFFLAAGEDRKRIEEDLVNAENHQGENGGSICAEDDDPTVLAKAKDLAAQAVKVKMFDVLRTNIMRAANSQTNWDALFGTDVVLDHTVTVELPDKSTKAVTIKLMKAPNVNISKHVSEGSCRPLRPRVRTPPCTASSSPPPSRHWLTPRSRLARAS